MNKYSWLYFSVHYHYKGWIDLLTYGIKPFTDEVLKRNYASDFMFFRSWERGTSIILVFKGKKEVLNGQLKPFAEKYFGEFFEKMPSKQEKMKLPLGHWFLPYPNNTLVFNHFRFHKLEIIQLSGGMTASKVAFRQLQLSSGISLEIMTISPKMDVTNAISIAILLIFTFIRTTGMDKGEAKYFTEELFENSLPKLKYMPKGFEKEKVKLKNSIKILRQGLAENFRNQQEYILHYLDNVWAMMGEEVEFEEEWLNSWVNGSWKNYRKVEKIQSEGRLVTPDYFKANHKIPVDHDKQELWTIYQYFVRTLCSQMGIHKSNELNVYYTLKEVFRDSVPALAETA